ncbi:hypothetical protein CTheo_8762 [Ceratobasidium theobromae]|uniref:Uncharacterized protein n=1 Tax=Ceratobasidium theobromae TaxID=1582974 RepID=A0A5N5Q8Q1_9AGAM|nr:hypothetical protein CTheo_8762 [Ceratobasidium theobromae]
MSESPERMDSTAGANIPGLTPLRPIVSVETLQSTLSLLYKTVNNLVQSVQLVAEGVKDIRKQLKFIGAAVHANPAGDEADDEEETQVVAGRVSGSSQPKKHP